MSQVECGVRGDLGDEILATATTTGLFVCLFVCLFYLLVCIFLWYATAQPQVKVNFSQIEEKFRNALCVKALKSISVKLKRKD